MTLTDTKLRNLKPREKPYSESDGGGLYIEVLPTGKKRWGLKYRARNRKQENVRLGDYPAYSLAEARSWREDCKALVERGLSPMAIKRGDPIPEDVSPFVKEMAETFIGKWCPKTREIVKAREEAARAADTVEVFAWRWYAEIVEPTNRNPRNIRRILEKDVIPAIGAKLLAEVTPDDILAVTDRIKQRGADQMALQTRNVLKRLFAYAIARQKTQFNPAAAIEARFIAQARSRDVALTAEEIGKLMRAIYQSSMKRSHKLALHLLILCMVRKSELIEARWEEIDFERAEWAIPGERMKKDKPHLVPLSRQALAMFEELKGLASGSEWVFPSRGDLKRPIAKSTLNVAVRALEIEVRDFVIHDFRRTASTHLHEQGFNSDWIEKALAHERQGVRGVYNRAEYLTQRRQMLQWWADFVDAQIQDGRGKVIIGPFGKAYQSMT
ncbi:MAG: tyrosine-type recombinase/integrase [Pseudomonadota bacterium]|jgi:integrase